MKVIHYLLFLAWLGCWAYAPTRSTMKIEKKTIVRGHQIRDTTVVTNSFFSRFAYNDKRLNIFPTYQALAAVEVYLRTGRTPFTTSTTPLRFIKNLRQRNQHFQIRNGELELLSKSYARYQEKLTEFHSLLDSVGGDPTQSWQQYKKRVYSYSNPKRTEVLWPRFKEKRKQCWKTFRQFRTQMKMAYETERALIRQYLYHAELFDSINHLSNTNGEPLVTYVFTRKKLFHGNPALGNLAGMVVMTKENGLFSSDTPSIRRDFPAFIGQKNNLAVFLNEGAGGATVSHEFGHLYYLYHHWDQYMTFIKSRRGLYVVGGHGKGDPSGEAAVLAELGKMPRLEKSIDRQPEEENALITAAAE